MGYLPVVVEAIYMGDYRIKLEFDNGEKRLVDCEPWLKGDIFQPLKDKNYFQRFLSMGDLSPGPMEQILLQRLSTNMGPQPNNPFPSYTWPGFHLDSSCHLRQRRLGLG